MIPLCACFYLNSTPLDAGLAQPIVPLTDISHIDFDL